MLDFHSHLIPGVDDGAASIDESRSAVAMMRAQGVRTIITTPHLRASLLHDRPDVAAEYLAAVDAGWEMLHNMVAAEFPDLTLGRGVELMLDAPHADLTDPRLRLNGTQYVLVEFSFGGMPPNSQQALFDLRMAGYYPIVAHPERYRDMDRDLALATSWKQVGAALQINAGSLIGMYGDRAKYLAWKLIRSGEADFLSSDYHARGDAPLSDARAAMQAAGGSAQHARLTTENPNRILTNDAPLAVPPLVKEETGWRRWFGKKNR